MSIYLQRKILDALLTRPRMSKTEIGAMISKTVSPERTRLVQETIDDLEIRQLIEIDVIQNLPWVYFKITDYGRQLAQSRAKAYVGEIAAPRRINTMSQPEYIPHSFYCRNDGHRSLPSRGTSC